MPAFSNSMDEGNLPDTSAESGELKIQNQTADAPSSSPWAGDDERPIQDNGTGGSHLGYVMGQPSGNSFPPCNVDEANETDDANIADFGINEGIEVGHDSGIANYGIVGPAAGGGVRKNIVE